MKKLMIAAAIVCAAALSQAATFNWQAEAGWVTADEMDETSTFIGNTVYVFDGTQYAKATFIEALGSTGAAAFENALSPSGNILGGDEVPGSFTIAGSGLYYDDIEHDTESKYFYSEAYAALVAQGTDGKDYVYIIDYAPVKDTAAVLKAGALFHVDDVYTGAVGGAGWYEVSSVPEPTSGLLLLLGMAGLALKRKRA